MPEVDLYHYQGGTTAPTCMHSLASNIDKGPSEQSVTSEPSVPPTDITKIHNPRYNRVTDSLYQNTGHLPCNYKTFTKKLFIERNQTKNWTKLCNLLTDRLQNKLGSK